MTPKATTGTAREIVVDGLCSDMVRGKSTVAALGEAYDIGRRAALDEQWQPIETAPKDGTIALVWVNWLDQPGVEVARWDGGWIPSGRSRPTPHAKYWQPIPEPPRALAASPRAGDETFGAFCDRIYRETGGPTPELRAAYEFYKANYRGDSPRAGDE